jgi:hypothetical protein
VDILGVGSGGGWLGCVWGWCCVGLIEGGVVWRGEVWCLVRWVLAWSCARGLCRELLDRLGVFMLLCDIAPRFVIPRRILSINNGQTCNWFVGDEDRGCCRNHRIINQMATFPRRIQRIAVNSQHASSVQISFHGLAPPAGPRLAG